jgi:UDP-3-O-[3-hydroxymyristoyl] glucosamine N-acyltransferase
MPLKLAALAEALGAELVGDGSGVVQRVAGLGDAASTDLTFAETAKALAAATGSRAAAIITGPFGRDSTPGPPLLVSPTPRLAFARAAALLAAAAPRAGGIHPTAVISTSATIGASVSIGPHASVGDDVVIGDGSVIGPGVVILGGARLGPGCVLVARVVVYAGTVLGARVIAHAGVVLGGDGFGYVKDPATGVYEKFPQIGTLEIGDDVEIGPNTTIDRGALGPTVIGAGTKIDNLVQIAHNCRVGRNVVIAALVGIAGSTRIDDDVIIGGQAGAGDHAHLEAGVILGGRAGVLPGKVVRGRGTIYWGTPARPVGEILREQATLARLAKKRRTQDR